MLTNLRKNLKQKFKSNKKMLNMSLSECMCPICLEVLVEPVTMPCKHEICLNCFETMLDKTNLTCPMCRMRISTWSRMATNNNTLVDKDRWKQIQEAFPHEIKLRLEGKSSQPIIDSLSKVLPSMSSKQGEIHKEYEEFIRKEQERLRLEKENEEKASLAAIEKLIKDEESLTLTQYMERVSNTPTNTLSENTQLLNTTTTTTTNQATPQIATIEEAKREPIPKVNLRARVTKDSIRAVTRTQSLRLPSKRQQQQQQKTNRDVSLITIDENETSIVTRSRAKKQLSNQN